MTQPVGAARLANGELAVAFVGCIVPDREPYTTPAFSRAGNLFQSHFLAALARCGMRPDLVLSFQPVPARPGAFPVWIPGERVEVTQGVTADLLPQLNLPLIKYGALGVTAFFRLLVWAWSRRKQRRLIYCYNLTAPPGLFLWLGARLSGSRIMASINDVNEPGQTVPDSLPFRADFLQQKWSARRLDGAVAVTDRIVQELAPGVPSVIMEGAASSNVLTLKNKADRGEQLETPVMTAVLAGSLDEYNGGRLLMEALRADPDLPVRVLVAGMGPLQREIEEAARIDHRVEFLGYLDHAQVLQTYANADVLLNIRLTRTVRTRYFFPSKLLEYLATGIPVISTPCSHVRREYAGLLHLLEEESGQGLALALRAVARIPAAARWTQAAHAREFMRTKKSWDAQARRVVRLVEEVCA